MIRSQQRWYALITGIMAIVYIAAWATSSIRVHALLNPTGPVLAIILAFIMLYRYLNVLKQRN